MSYRKLGIAWSVLWASVAVLLVALWVRSFWWNDILVLKPPESRYAVNSALGRTDFCVGDRTQRTWDNVEPWAIQTAKIDKHFEPPLSKYDANYNRFGVLATRFYYDRGAEAFSVSFPTLYPSGFAVGIAAIPWIIAVRRFSLRALLIATTLIAAGLGLFTWGAH